MRCVAGPLFGIRSEAFQGLYQFRVDVASEKLSGRMHPTCRKQYLHDVHMASGYKTVIP